MSMNKTQRCQAAIDYRRQGLNCSQCLLAAFADVAGLTLEQAMALGAGMGGGVRCGSICGAVSTPVMLLGTACRPHRPPCRHRRGEGVSAALSGAFSPDGLPGAAAGPGSGAVGAGPGAGRRRPLRPPDRHGGGAPHRYAGGGVIWPLPICTSTRSTACWTAPAASGTCRSW